jgi:hypothetical protein
MIVIELPAWIFWLMAVSIALSLTDRIIDARRRKAWRRRP